MKKGLLLIGFLVTLAAFARAQNAKPDTSKNTRSRQQDSLAIIQTALDYIDGYYTSDAARMERALHPELSKKIVFKTQRGEQLGQMSALTLIQITKENPPTPEAKREKQVFVTDIFRDAGTVVFYFDQD